MNNEPSLEGIEDFNNHESPETRSIIIKVIVGILIVGVIYTGFRVYFSNVSDQLDTTAKPAVYDVKHK